MIPFKRISALPLIALAALLGACTSPGPIKAPEPSAPVVIEPAAPEVPVLTPRMAAAAEVLSRMATLQDRLYQVAAPLLINSAPLCQSHARSLLGFTAKNRYSYPGEFNDAAHAVFGMNERLQVTGVLGGSGAARAGLRRGDRLITAGGKAIPTGPNASTLVGAVFGPLVRSRANMALTVERDGTSSKLSIPVTRACGFGIELGNADNINSYADGQRVMVTRGMINFARNDDELAILLAKGMAHNILGHAGVMRNAGTIGSIIDNLMRITPDLSMLIGSAGIKAASPELDAEADHLSLYLLARAGYNINAAAPFWKRLAASYPASVLNGYVANHPATAFRVQAIERALGEIKAKQASKKALVP